MQIGIVGLGRMGGNMARRLARGGARIVAFDRDAAARDALREPGITCVDSLDAVPKALSAPRVVWLMLPAGAPTAETLASLSRDASAQDVLVDGANAHYRDSVERARTLAEIGVGFVDAGVSGGIWGLEQGYTIMLGGDPAHVERVLPFVRILAPAADRGWLHCGRSGAGHFAKMVHNGIEYGLMQAYAEGFALLEAKRELAIDVAAVAECWRHGSVVRLVAAGSDGRSLARRSAEPRRRRALRGGLGRRPLVPARGARSGCAHAGDERGGRRAIRDAGQGGLRCAPAGEDAPGVRRAHDTGTALLRRSCAAAGGRVCDPGGRYGARGGEVGDRHCLLTRDAERRQISLARKELR